MFKLNEFIVHNIVYKILMKISKNLLGPYDLLKSTSIFRELQKH
jgi:hypothetical protein